MFFLEKILFNFLVCCFSILPCKVLLSNNNHADHITLTYAIADSSTLNIHGTTNINKFICSSDKLHNSLQATYYKDTISNTIYFQNAVLSTEIKSFDCGNPGMNNGLYHIMKADQYPTIKLETVSTASDTTFDFSHWLDLKVKMLITIAGVSRPAVIKIYGKKIGSDKYAFIGQHKIYMTKFHIKPPTAFFGLIKVQDVLLIDFNLIIVSHIIKSN